MLKNPNWPASDGRDVHADEHKPAARVCGYGPAVLAELRRDYEEVDGAVRSYWEPAEHRGADAFLQGRAGDR
ncbi:hypothetical protein AYI70_g3133 [Smittium culicis]|uniref:Uncharacterized protein n=1 Tax=Smittium culicis TaxID=133412 RepID=A0A1R1Y5H9_9FUNG|nr:hypothetical protein AYI70_g3133 [Smittium culicis]